MVRTIQEDWKIHISIVVKRQDRSYHDRDGRMMEQVQEGDLASAFPQNEEPRVEELEVLLEIEQHKDLAELHSFQIVRNRIA